MKRIFNLVILFLISSNVFASTPGSNVFLERKIEELQVDLETLYSLVEELKENKKKESIIVDRTFEKTFFSLKEMGLNPNFDPHLSAKQVSKIKDTVVECFNMIDKGQVESVLDVRGLHFLKPTDETFLGSKEVVVKGRNPFEAKRGVKNYAVIYINESATVQTCYNSLLPHLVKI